MPVVLESSAVPNVAVSRNYTFFVGGLRNESYYSNSKPCSLAHRIYPAEEKQIALAPLCCLKPEKKTVF